MTQTLLQVTIITRKCIKAISISYDSSQLSRPSERMTPVISMLEHLHFQKKDYVLLSKYLTELASRSARDDEIDEEQNEDRADAGSQS